MKDTIALPYHPIITHEENNETSIEIGGLHPGYGITLGNALKRVLHSSLPGAAVTSVKIEGVKHEFSTIPYVLEDVLTVLLNLKQVRFKVFSDEPQRITFKVKGERAFTAGDFDIPSTVAVMNPDAHIATLTDKRGVFEGEIMVEKGVGYVTRDMMRREKVQVGELPLDAIFTPVRKVRYEVENMRVGTATNYDRLRLAIQTDGSLSPKEAFVAACDILNGQLQELMNFAEDAGVSAVADEVRAPDMTKETEDENAFDPMEVAIEDLKLSSRTINALARVGFTRVRDVADKSVEDLLEIDGLGEKSVEEVDNAFTSIGVTLVHRDI